MLGKSVSAQMSSLLRSDAIANSPEIGLAPAKVIEHEDTHKKVRRRRATSAKEVQNEESISFAYNSEVHGVPNQQWKTAEKALWLIAAVKNYANVEELTSKQIVNLFNKHFKQFGANTSSNVTRDLGRLRKESPSPVGLNTNTDPNTFYLTTEGVKRVGKMIANPTE